MHRSNFESLGRELGKPQFLTMIDQIAQANYTLAEMYSGLHATGFADWQGSFWAAMEAGSPAMAETLGLQIEDPKLREAFYTLLEHTKSLIEIDQQIIAWLARFVGMETIQDKQDRTKLNRRLHRIAAEDSEVPQGPVWVIQPEYQEFLEESRQAMIAVTQAWGQFSQRLEQLLGTVGGTAAWEPAQAYGTSGEEAIKPLISSIPKDVERLVVTSKLEGDFAYLQMEVVTFADLWERGEIVVDFIERVWDAFEPFQVKLEAIVYSRRKPRHSRPRIFGLKPTWKKWAETRRLLLEGEVARIVVYDWESTHSHCLRFDSDVYLGVHFGRPWEQARGHRMKKESMFDPREAKVFSLCVNTRVWGGTVSSEVQEQIVSLACDLFQAVDGTCGYVDLGDEYVTLDAPTRYERRLGLAMQGPNTRRLCDEVRGVFWGNLLSTRHVRALGGSQFVRQRAPRSKIISLAHRGEWVANGVPLYLQMTQTLEAAAPEDYARLEAFLSPILISSRGQRGITVLDHALVASLGDADGLKQTLADSVRRAALLPCGALLIEYDLPDDGAAANKALERIGCAAAQGYRDIPQLRSMWWPDDASVATLIELIPSRPKSGPIYPTIVVQSCILGNVLEFQVSFVDPPTSDIEDQLREVVQEWSALEYESEPEVAMISHCSVPERKEEAIAWHANLAPVGQDAYFQLVMMLDEFSKTTAKLAEVHVGAWFH